MELEVVFYEDLSIFDGQIWWKGMPLEIDFDDRIIIRWPWVIENDDCYDYNIFVQIIVDKHSSQILLDQKCLSKYSPFYEDKLFQSFVFNDVGISTPRTWYYTDKERIYDNEIKFPIVVKKRISSRSKHNIRIDSVEELEKFLEGKNIFDYLFQEYIDAQHDVRITILFDEILGAVKRDMHVREGNRLAVKGMSVYDLNDHEIATGIRRVTSYMGADLVGFDLLIKEDGSHYFIEANMSPLVSSFSKTTHVNPVDKVLEKLKF